MRLNGSCSRIGSAGEDAYARVSISSRTLAMNSSTPMGTVSLVRSRTEMLPGLDLLLAQDEHVGHAVDAGGPRCNLVADLLVAVVAHHADAGGLELGRDLVRVVAALLGDGQDLDLHGREPHGKLAGEVLDEDADEALDGTEAHAVQHDGALLGTVGVDVLEVEVLRHLEVELHGAALPGAAEGVLQVEVDAWAVEGAVALVRPRTPCQRSSAVLRPASARSQSRRRPDGVLGRVESSRW